MQKCKNFKYYKAVRPPTCGCEACNKKWGDKVDEALRSLDLLGRDPQKILNIISNREKMNNEDS